jgi:hypothetical protein
MAPRLRRGSPPRPKSQARSQRRPPASPCLMASLTPAENRAPTDLVIFDSPVEDDGPSTPTSAATSVRGTPGETRAPKPSHMDNRFGRRSYDATAYRPGAFAVGPSCKWNSSARGNRSGGQERFQDFDPEKPRIGETARPNPRITRPDGAVGSRAPCPVRTCQRIVVLPVSPGRLRIGGFAAAPPVLAESALHHDRPYDLELAQIGLQGRSP